MRYPYVINTNTRIAYTPSESALKLVREQDRRVFPENLEWSDDECPSLVAWCVITISKNFVKHPIFNELPGSERDHLLELLPTDLPLELVIPLISDEIYWKRRYADKFGLVMQRLLPGWTWKTVFIERYMQERVEQAQPQYNDEYEMEDITKLCRPYVHRLLVTELQAWKPPLTWGPNEIPEVYPTEHINFTPILKNLPGIEELDIMYGQNKVAEEFNWNMFAVSVLDYKRLGEAVLQLDNLRILRVHRSNVGDRHIQALMQSIVKNKTLIELDLSNCCIGDQGALCIAKVMTIHPTLEILKLGNNQIKALGTEGIGFALLEESCCPLIHLDLRLNPLEHEGIMGILRALVRGDKPKEVNLSGCLFEDITPIRIAQMLNINTSLEVLNVSSNWFGEDGGEAVIASLENNKAIKWLDLRESNIPPHLMRIIKKLLDRNKNNKDESEEEEEICEEEPVEEELPAPEEKVETAEKDD